MTALKVLTIPLLVSLFGCPDHARESGPITHLEDQSGTPGESNPIMFTASTPGDPQVKAMLGIPAETPVDFIRWDLTLQPPGSGKGDFDLKILFGESLQGSPGFKGGGQPLSMSGKWEVAGASGKEIYRLTGKQNHPDLSLLKINENLFQILTPDHHLMIGNGGWSYTLNRKNPVDPGATLPVPGDLSFLKEEKAEEVTFDGRTPCPGAEDMNHIPGNADCYKLKWRLILYRDPATGAPTTYKLITIYHRAVPVEGAWDLVSGSGRNENALICRLDPDKPDLSMSFLVGDDNVLFFLDKDDRLMTGDGDFSFTLDRKRN